MVRVRADRGDTVLIRECCEVVLGLVREILFRGLWCVSIVRFISLYTLLYRYLPSPDPAGTSTARPGRQCRPYAPVAQTATSQRGGCGWVLDRPQNGQSRQAVSYSRD